MARGFALLVGLKEVDPAMYGGWTGENGCWGCELDVDNVKRILAPLGFDFGVLKTAEANATNVLDALNGASSILGPDDIFVFYYSGHGGQQPDASGDEPDGKDETLVAYDRQINDDELNEIWPSFSTGTRIVMLSDSCNSGSNYKMLAGQLALSQATPMRMFSQASKKERRAAMNAQMIHMGGCRDGGTSAGYYSGGAFTTALCNAWDGGNFSGNYRDLYDEILEEIVGESQQPQYSEYGPVTDAFKGQRPFTISSRGTSADSEPIPTREEVSRCLDLLPITWLHRPALARDDAFASTERIGPLVAAAIGVAVGAGIQLTSQELNRAAVSRPGMPSVDLQCTLTISRIADLAGDLVDLAREDESVSQALRAIVDTDEGRPLPVVAACFLAGVAAGAAAARREPAFA